MDNYIIDILFLVVKLTNFNNRLRQGFTAYRIFESNYHTSIHFKIAPYKLFSKAEFCGMVKKETKSKLNLKSTNAASRKGGQVRASKLRNIEKNASEIDSKSDSDETGGSSNRNDSKGDSDMQLKMKKKIDAISSILNELYPTPPVPLDYSNNFSFLIAVVLSAQTTDGKVNSVTPELFQRAPTPEVMSKMDVDEVQNIIRVVGLAKSKAKYVVNLSKALVERFNSEVPSSYEDLESLPGVGHKTASVVRSHLFDIPSIAVDTHVHRLAIRWGLTKSTTTNPSIVQQDLEALFPMELWSKVHIQMIYYGREYCTAKNHIVSECPVCYHLKYGTARGNASAGANNLFNQDHSDTMNSATAPASPTPKQTSTQSSIDLSPFSPKKTGKGIISYQQRMDDVASGVQSQSESASVKAPNRFAIFSMNNTIERIESKADPVAATSSSTATNTRKRTRN